MSAHTPGPWAYQEESDAYTHIVRADKRRFLVQLAQDSSGEAEANARLMAAAPDLLAALMGMLDQPEDADSYDARLQNAMTAIAKATQP